MEGARMLFGEKLRSVRIAQNLSQTELAEMAGISERTIYSYEQTGVFPRPNVLKKLAAALNITASYLLGEEESDKHASIDQDLFLAKAKESFGYKGAREAREVISRAAALFAGGDLDDKAKDIFFQSIMEVYLESKTEAREKFSSRRRVGRKKKVSETS
jgi:transcriptional regulator with XRE-family HTH domain